MTVEDNPGKQKSGSQNPDTGVMGSYLLDSSTLWGTVVEETKEDMLVRILTCLTDIEEDILTEGFDDLNDWIGDIQDKIEEVKTILESEEDDDETI